MAQYYIKPNQQQQQQISPYQQQYLQPALPGAVPDVVPQTVPQESDPTQSLILQRTPEDYAPCTEREKQIARIFMDKYHQYMQIQANGVKTIEDQKFLQSFEKYNKMLEDEVNGTDLARKMARCS